MALPRTCSYALIQHRNGLIEGFTSRYGVHRLVWFEQHPDTSSAIRREKQLKKWNATES